MVKNKGKNCSVFECEKPAQGYGLCSAHKWKYLKYGSPLGGFRNRGDSAKALDAAMEYEGDLCLIWPKARDKKGYARVTIGRTTFLAGRVICERVNGAPPFPLAEAAHNCGQGHMGCVNKRHLAWKSHHENVKDKQIHGTQLRGEQVHCAKLTKEKVIEMRRRRPQSTLTALAKEYGVSSATVHWICKGKYWAWLKEGLPL